MRAFYVGLSTLLMTLVIGWASLVGFQRLVSGEFNGMLGTALKVFLGACFCVSLIHLFRLMFVESMSLAEALSAWVKGCVKLLCRNWRSIAAGILLAAVALCFAAGAVTVATRLHQNAVIAADTEKAIAARTAPLNEKIQALQLKLSSVEAAVQSKTTRIADLEARVKALASENAKLQETVKRAAGTRF